MGSPGMIYKISNYFVLFTPPHSYAYVIWGLNYFGWDHTPPCPFLHVCRPCCVSYELCCNMCILLCFLQTRTVWCCYSDKIYLYQLIVKSAVFYALMEWCALVNEMLLMMAGDIESNPGPREYCIVLVVINSPSSVSRQLSTTFSACLHISVQEYLGSMVLVPTERVTTAYGHAAV